MISSRLGNEQLNLRSMGDTLVKDGLALYYEKNDVLNVYDSSGATFQSTVAFPNHFAMVAISQSAILQIS